MPRPAISVENLSKAYRIGLQEEIPDTLTSALAGFVKTPWKKFRQLQRLNTFRNTEESADTFWALKDVSFDVQEGEVLGVIGRNGAGKSTLLKILSRITEPTSGRAVIRGRVSSLLEVGTGFHPELSGRENVYLNGTILGMTKPEIDRKFDEIVDFSGVEKFLDTPIKRYSSGMKVRLAFAVAAHLEPEILIIDEVLAVGDAEFQNRCMGKMEEVAQGGRTVLFVSHNMTAVENLCSRAIVLEAGRVAGDEGDVSAMISVYLQSLRAQSVEDLLLVNRPEGYSPTISKLELLDESGLSNNVIRIGGQVTVRIHYRTSQPVFNPGFGFAIEDSRGHRILWVNSRCQRGPLPTVSGGGFIDCRIPILRLLPGEYSVTAGFSRGRENVDVVPHAGRLRVAEADIFGTGELPPSSKCKTFTECVWDDPCASLCERRSF
jgi:lipopolysaccharide transport system ATP-binding protein